jgi:hypothetical protein
MTLALFQGPLIGEYVKKSLVFPLVESFASNIPTSQMTQM